ncbi:MAG: hypothetical protein JWR10_1770 [Rubritepida sp.]|nr:hypothetical protein [Rubritepida sp.]
MILAVTLALLAMPASAQPTEPAAAAQLRRLLGSDVTLSFATATATDVQGSAAFTAMVLTKGTEIVRVAEARLDGLRDDGIARLSLRGITIEGAPMPIALDRLDLEGLTVRRPGPGQKPVPDSFTADLLRLENWRSGGDSPVNVGAINIENYGTGRTGQATMTALEVGLQGAGPVDRVTIARVAYSGLDAAELLTALVAQRPPVTAPGRSSLDIEGVTVSQGGTAVARLGAFAMRGEITPGRPHSGSVALRGLEVNPSPPHAEWMQRLGYASLRAEARLDATHDVPARVFDLSEFSFELREAGELHFSLRADNVPEGMSEQQRQSMRLVSARLRYADLSLFQRWVRAQAAQQRIAEPALRQSLIQQSDAMLPGPTLADARNAMQRFLRGEATVLELSASPSAPLSLSQITGKPQSSLAGWQRMLGLTLTAR